MMHTKSQDNICGNNADKGDVVKTVILIAVAMTLGQSLSVAEKLAPDTMILDAEAVVMPLDRILLISRNDFLGAVKFISNEDRPDGIYSKYSYFEYEKGGFRKVREGFISYRKIVWNVWNKIKYKYLQFHPNPYDYADRLKFSNFELFASVGYDHSAVHFWNKARVVDDKVRLAPTPWKQISEVDLNDKRIQWFKYDETRKRRIIQIDRLW